MEDLQRTRLIRAFTDHLPLPATLEPHLKEALKRVLQNPGSLRRPEIALEVALCYEVPKVIATDLAIALEYFHTASLLFDDLPAMDDAVERRGIPCVHVERRCNRNCLLLPAVNRHFVNIRRNRSTAGTRSFDLVLDVDVARCPAEAMRRFTRRPFENAVSAVQVDPVMSDDPIFIVM